MDYTKLSCILMKWAIESQEYELVYFLYVELHIGIPAKYMYQLPQRQNFSSSTDFIENEGVLWSILPIVNKLYALFPKSKWIKLEEWGGNYGYRYPLPTVPS